MRGWVKVQASFGRGSQRKSSNDVGFQIWNTTRFCPDREYSTLWLVYRDRQSSRCRCRRLWSTHPHALGSCNCDTLGTRSDAGENWLVSSLTQYGDVQLRLGWRD